jgi:hypothetical protein
MYVEYANYFCSIPSHVIFNGERLNRAWIMIFTFLCVALEKHAQLGADKIETNTHFIVDGIHRTDNS